VESAVVRTVPWRRNCSDPLNCCQIAQRNVGERTQIAVIHMYAGGGSPSTMYPYLASAIAQRFLPNSDASLIDWFDVIPLEMRPGGKDIHIFKVELGQSELGLKTAKHTELNRSDDPDTFDFLKEACEKGSQTRKLVSIDGFAKTSHLCAPTISLQMDLDYTEELAQLLRFTSRVAIAIRKYSAYSGKAASRQAHAAYDLWWLSDCLHNFERLGEVLMHGSPDSIVNACDALIESYKLYGEEHKDLPGSKAAFDRNEHLISLDEGIAIFEAIRAKALRSASASEPAA
jgi:hypothetical protein